MSNRVLLAAVLFACFAVCIAVVLVRLSALRGRARAGRVDARLRRSWTAAPSLLPPELVLLAAGVAGLAAMGLWAFSPRSQLLPVPFSGALDDLAARLSEQPRVFDVLDRLVSRPALGLAVATTALIAGLLGRWPHVLLLLSAPVVAVQATERLWKLVLAPEDLMRSSYPSGHATAFTAVCLAIALAFAWYSRPVLAVAGFATAATAAISGAITVVASGKHGVPDAAGGVLAGVLATASTAIVLAQVNQWLDRFFTSERELPHELSSERPVRDG